MIIRGQVIQQSHELKSKSNSIKIQAKFEQIIIQLDEIRLQ